MTTNKFHKIVFKSFNRCLDILKKKEKEYVLDNSDRFKAFKLDYLNNDNINEKEVLIGQMIKHISSIYDMSKQDLKFDKENYDLWIEKITDIIIYMWLLEGIIYERVTKYEQ